MFFKLSAGFLGTPLFRGCARIRPVGDSYFYLNISYIDFFKLSAGFLGTPLFRGYARIRPVDDFYVNIAGIDLFAT